MKKLGKLTIKPENLIRGAELQNFRGGSGSCGPGWLQYICLCYYSEGACPGGGCEPAWGPACIPEGVEPNVWAATNSAGQYDYCICTGGY